MPIRKKKTKTTKGKNIQIQKVKQSVKVIINNPVKTRRGPSKGILSGLMRAPEYTTFRDLMPVQSSTGFVANTPEQPVNRGLYQARLEAQDSVGSFSGSIASLPPPVQQGLIEGPKFEDITDRVLKLEMEKENREKGIIKGQKTRENKKIADAFRKEKLLSKTFKEMDKRAFPVIKFSSSDYNSSGDDTVGKKTPFRPTPVIEDEDIPMLPSKTKLQTQKKILAKMKSINNRDNK